MESSDFAHLHCPLNRGSHPAISSSVAYTWPHVRQTARRNLPGDPGKSAQCSCDNWEGWGGVGDDRGLRVGQRERKGSSQSCLTLWDPMDCLPGSSIHGILQARILEWMAISFSRGSSRPRDLNPGLPHCRQTLYHLSHQGSCGWVHIYTFGSRKLGISELDPACHNSDPVKWNRVSHSVVSDSFWPHGL